MVNGATKALVSSSPEEEIKLAALKTSASPSNAELLSRVRQAPIAEAQTEATTSEVEHMTEKLKSELISRRTAFSLLGLPAAFALAVPATVLAVSDVEAQTSGMERRGERRKGRHERRDTRREGRHERRDTRRGGGKETTGSGATGTGTTGTK